MFQAHPQHYALAHPLLLSYLAMLPVRHTLSNMVLVPKNPANLSQKQDFAEDTVGSKFGAPELKPRKSLLHGTNFYCLGLSTAKPKIAPFLDFLALKASGQYCCYAPGAVAAAQLHEESERQSCQTLFYNVLVHVLQTTTLPVGTRIILSHRMRIILKHRRIRISSKHKRPG